MNTGIINALPAYYIEPSNIHAWLTEIFDSPFGLPCICGDQTVGVDPIAVRPKIINICQRSDDPCKIEVKFHLGTAQGVYNYQPSLSGFSFDTTDGLNGIWHQLNTDTSDVGHNPSPISTLVNTNSVNASWNTTLYDPTNPNHGDQCDPNWSLLGIPVHTFIFDMCEHVSSWLSEQTVSFRLSFDQTKDGVYSRISCGVIMQ